MPRDSFDLIAHRGWSGLHPESTVAAYRAAIDFAAEHQLRLWLEADVWLCGTGEVVVSHDQRTARTAKRDLAIAETSLTDLRGLDFGSWVMPQPTGEQRSLITLGELMVLVERAREARVEVQIAIETKHLDPDDLAVDRGVAELLQEAGWVDSDSPVRVMSFAGTAISYFAATLPEVRRTFLLDVPTPLDPKLVVDTIGISLRTLREQPQLCQQYQAAGMAVNVWTVNDPDDISWCASLGVNAITSNHLDRLLAARA